MPQMLSKYWQRLPHCLIALLDDYCFIQDIQLTELCRMESHPNFAIPRQLLRIFQYAYHKIPSQWSVRRTACLFTRTADLTNSACNEKTTHFNSPFLKNYSVYSIRIPRNSFPRIYVITKHCTRYLLILSAEIPAIVFMYACIACLLNSRCLSIQDALYCTS